MRTWLAAAIALGLIGCARSERMATADQGSRGQTSHTRAPSAASREGGSDTSPGIAKADQEAFMTQAAQDNLAEVDMGRLAEIRASDARVKDYGRMLAREHMDAYQKLQDIAKKLGATLPNEPDRTHLDTRATLAKLRGEQFDRAFIKHMISDHEKTIALFKDKGQSSSDPQVKEYANQTLPILQKHLDVARQLDQQLGKSGTPIPSGAAGQSRTGVPTGAQAGSDPDAGPGTSSPAGKGSEADTGSDEGQPSATTPEEENEGGTQTE